MFAIAFAFFVAAIYLLWQWKNVRNSSDGQTPLQGEDMNPTDSSFTPSTDVLNGNLDNIAEPASWKIYKNEDLEFSLNVPKNVLGVDNCKNTKFEAPVVVLEDEYTSAVFIVPQYYFDKYTPDTAQPVSESGDVTFEEDDPVNTGDPNLSDTDGDGVFDCRKKFYTLPLVKQEILGSKDANSTIPLLGNPFAGVSLRTTRIENTENLNLFIKRVFGQGCVLAKKEVWVNQEGFYRLEIKSTGVKNSLGEEIACAMDQVSDILYNPSKDKLVYLYLPEKDRLSSGEGAGYDKEMLASFRFDD